MVIESSPFEPKTSTCPATVEHALRDSSEEDFDVPPAPGLMAIVSSPVVPPTARSLP